MTYSFTTSQSLPQPSFMETFTYDSVWKDRLYQYKYWIGTTLNYTQTYSYDNAGNVTSISDSRGSAYSSEYAWEGRTLTGVSLGGSTTDIAYAYNQNGIRIEKTVNGTVTTQYLVDGSRVLYESNGTNTLYYTYDVDGSLISFNYNGTDYFYVYNALGDIVKLLNASGQVVVEYRYDAFGNILFQTTGTLASANPYRYRGYRYDEETKLYYLNSRYYNPQTGRFLNADGLLQESQTTLGFNLFAYVENNPVVNIDPSGYCVYQDSDSDVSNNLLESMEQCGGMATGKGANYWNSFGTYESWRGGYPPGTTSSPISSNDVVGNGINSGLGSMIVKYGPTFNWMEGFYSTGSVHNKTIVIEVGTGSTKNRVGKANSYYFQMDSKGNITKIAYYNEYGRQSYRIDFDHPHTINGIKTQPHVHFYEYGVRNGIYQQVDESVGGYYGPK